MMMILVLIAFGYLEFGLALALYIAARSWPDCPRKYRWEMVRELGLVAVLWLPMLAYRCLGVK